LQRLYDNPAETPEYSPSHRQHHGRLRSPDKASVGSQLEDA
jgi:hypothetical protein